MLVTFPSLPQTPETTYSVVIVAHSCGDSESWLGHGRRQETSVATQLITVYTYGRAELVRLGPGRKETGPTGSSTGKSPVIGRLPTGPTF